MIDTLVVIGTSGNDFQVVYRRRVELIEEGQLLAKQPYHAAEDLEILASFITHGNGKGWQFAQKSAVLLLGRNSALIFQKERLNETGDGMKIQKNKAGQISIIFPTEASDGILKWDGKKYTWRETQP